MSNEEILAYAKAAYDSGKTKPATGHFWNPNKGTSCLLGAAYCGKIGSFDKMYDKSWSEFTGKSLFWNQGLIAGFDGDPHTQAYYPNDYDEGYNLGQIGRQMFLPQTPVGLGNN